MKFNLAILLSSIGISAATSIMDLPSCALGCYAQAVGNSSCELSDSYCQCTTGYRTILDTAIPCLCYESDCTSEDLITAQEDTNKICSSALASSSQGFTAATFGLNVCQAAATGTVASASASTTGSSDGNTTSGATHIGAEGSWRLMAEVIAVGFAGLAVLAL